MIFDTHAHYTSHRFDSDRHALLQSLPQKGVAGVVDCAVDFATAREELALAGRLGKKSGYGVYRWPAETLPDAGKAAAPSGGGLICFGRADRLHRL